MRHIATVGLALAGIAATAQSYYTVDTVNDWVCKVNVNTGAVTYVGYMGAGNGVTTLHLASMNGSLMALAHAYLPNTLHVRKIAVTGSNAGLTTLFGNVWNLTYTTDKMGGFDYTGTSFVIVAGAAPNAYLFGTWDPSTSAWTYLGPVGPGDVDGYGYFGGKSWAVDVVDQANGVLTYSAPLAPLPVIGGDAFDPSGFGNPADLADLNANEFVAMGQTGKAIVRISKVGGFRTAVIPLTGAQSNAVFRGIAYCFPEQKVIRHISHR